MSNTPLCIFLLICVAAWHADASQQARLREFIHSRWTSMGSSSNSAHDPMVGATATSRLRAEYSVTEQANLKDADKITALPGQPNSVSFGQYSGYVTVDEKNGRALFYYLAEAVTDAAMKPLVLWLNGGPGCSSFGYGAMIELGPFRINSDNKTLSTNEHAWNNVANVIFLDSPAGVGFSYSNTTSDYDRSGDQRTADDAFLFLVNWLERFPEYKGRPFYISGESYAGHFVPQITATVLSHNMNNATRTSLNLQGILVGNPYLDNNMNTKGVIDFLWSHAVISDEVFANITKSCNFNMPDSKECSDAMAVYDSTNIDLYDIYGPVCIDAPNGTYYPSCYIPGYDPCSAYYVDAYLNDPDVQKVLYTRTTKWAGCTDLHWKDSPASMVLTLKFLMANGLPVWLFSGDFDSVCPFPATRYTIHDLGIAVTEPWRPWTASKEVGGYVQAYTEGLVFATVRGAGHQVPYFKPEKALILVSSFLKGILPTYEKGE
uniref:Uncharacterized protein n=1 Tax=Avena sativa TaxID=4498 RepID=A0ACD5Y143_AVESA